MNAIVITLGFGLVVIATVFLVFIFYRAFHDHQKRTDHRYRVVAAALAVGSVGVGMWAFNPLLQGLGGPPLPVWGMFIASALILTSACALIGSTAMGGSKATLKCFLVACAVWTLACFLWFGVR